MENFIDRTEATLDMPKKLNLKKTDDGMKELSVAVTNGHNTSVSSVSPATSPSMLTDDEIEQAVFSTTSIHMENRVSTDRSCKFQAKEHVFSSSSSVEEEISIKSSTLPLVSSNKETEEVRSYYTPGFSIRAWAYEDISHKKNEPESSTITHVEHKERKTSITSTLIINKNKDFELEKKQSENREISSLSFNVGKSPKKQTNTVHVTLNKSIEYDLEDRSPQKKEFSHATFNIGNKKSPETNESVAKSLFADPNDECLSKSNKLSQNDLSNATETSQRSTSRDMGGASCDKHQMVKDDWVIISEDNKLLTAESKVSIPNVLSSVPIPQTDSESSISGLTSAVTVVSAPIEIERKFTVGPDTEAKLTKLGAKLKSVKSFTDIYLDNDAYSLTLSDCWLRRRNNDWEMKIPVKSCPIFDASTKYQELTKEMDIVDFLSNTLKMKSLAKSNINSLLEAASLVEFATIDTTRKTFNLGECEIDLDITNHGFQVGEIEVMASSPSDIPAALHMVNNMALELGWSPLQLVL